MRPQDIPLGKEIKKKLLAYEKNFRPLRGIKADAARNCLVEQMIESIRRIHFINRIDQQNKPFHPDRANPSSDIFDPHRAAIIYKRQGDIDEACWLTFLSVHFGKHLKTKWGLTKAVYGHLNHGGLWDWQTTSTDPTKFIKWLGKNQDALKATGKFSSHRQYESLKPTHTGKAIQSYVDWIGKAGSHAKTIAEAVDASKNSGEAFDYLYRTMEVTRFGRLAKFDYLTLLGKLRLAPIEPNSTYIHEATGPLRGACLLFANSTTASLNTDELESWLAELHGIMKFNFGLQVLEDSLCNWQKSPTKFIPYRG